MRVALLVAIFVGFTGLGVLDLLAGQLRLGVAALLLAVVNCLLLLGGN